MNTPRRRFLILFAALAALACLAVLPSLVAPSFATAGIWLGSYLVALLFLAKAIPRTSWFAPLLWTVCATHNFWEFRDDFFGDRVYSATKGSNVGHGYTITDTSTAGTPTYTDVDGSESGEFAATFDSQAEIQNVCLSQGNQLQFDIDQIVEFWCRVKMNGATLDSATSFAIGLAGDRNDAIDSIAQAALFRIIGDNSIVVETDDGTVNNDDVATGKSLTNSYAELTISFAAGKSDVRFFVNGNPVATGTTFDMSNYSGALQLFAQIQKTADTNTDGFVLDDWKVRGRKTLVAA